MKDYQFKEWKRMVDNAKESLESTSHSVEDEVTVVVAERLEKLESFVHWISRDWVELSHKKVMQQRNDYIMRAKYLAKELHDDNANRTI